MLYILQHFKDLYHQTALHDIPENSNIEKFLNYTNVRLLHQDCGNSIKVFFGF